MKKLSFLTALIAGSLIVHTAKAQIGVHLNVNLGPRPVYVPAPVPVINQYYYLPDANAYYSVPERVYYYQNNGRWITSPRLAGKYRDYDYSRMRYFLINEPRPYLRNDFYRSRYNSNYNVRNQRGFRNEYYNAPRGNDYRGSGNVYNRPDRNDRFNASNYRNGRNNQRGYSRY